eukprot:XP_001707344.1 Hypothetical protein GL50803_97052 [Giardia lamblia ATCC 50803]
MLYDFPFLVFPELAEPIILGSHENRKGRAVEGLCLPIPLLYASKACFGSEVEYIKKDHGPIAHQREHVLKFRFSAEVPDGQEDGVVV